METLYSGSYTQPVGLGHQVLKTFAIYPSDRARVSRQSVENFLFFSFSFIFFSFSFLFFFERLIGLFIEGGPNLLQVIKGTRPDFCRA